MVIQQRLKYLWDYPLVTVIDTVSGPSEHLVSITRDSHEISSLDPTLGISE
jgi:hypothetical protein